MRNNEIAVKRGRFFSEVGSSKKAIYSPLLQKDGTITLEVSGYEDTDEIMNEYAKSCSLEALLTRFSNGDLSALNRFEGLYMDLTEFPDNRIDAMQYLINAEHRFDMLPKEIRQKYDNNWRYWISQADQESWLKDLGINVNEKVDEVKTDEQEQ